MKDAVNWIIRSVSYLPSGQGQTLHLFAGYVEIGWNVLAPSDYHLFQSIQNSLNKKNFHSLEVCKNL